MLKVFLVEDEFIVREGIKNKIDWRANGYDFCGEAADGELAFPLIQKLKPDIVITDIKMPFMDGIELSRLIKKELPMTEIIILSGYEEFEYAKEAIRIGVAQYLLKPISGDGLLKELAPIAEKINERFKENRIVEQYLEEMEENHKKEKQTLFKDLVTASKGMSELLEAAEGFGVNLLAACYNLLLVNVESLDHTRNEFSNHLVAAQDTVDNLYSEYNVAGFDRDMEGIALLFMADSHEELKENLQAFVKKLEKSFEGNRHIRYFVGIGKPVNRLRELSESFEAASRAFAFRHLTGKSLILDGTEMKDSVPVVEDSFAPENINFRQLTRSRLVDFIRFGNEEESVFFIDDFFNAIGAGAMQSGLFRQYIIMDTYFCVSEFVNGLSLTDDDKNSLEVPSGMIGTIESAKEYIESLINTALKLREKSASSHYDAIVSEVISYLEQNYKDEDLSLNQIASLVNFSPNHLSTVFSQQTGNTFIKYLTDLRMNKAKELLKCTGMRSSEISFEVGYHDPHYFSYLFKKTQGQTPTEYRNS